MLGFKLNHVSKRGHRSHLHRVVNGSYSATMYAKGRSLTSRFLSGVPDLFDRNKILSGGDLSHYQVPHCIRVFFYLFDLCLFVTIFNFILNYVPIVTFWIFTYHKIWILLIIFCFIRNYWIIYFFNMFGSGLECCELTGVSLLWSWLIKWK